MNVLSKNIIITKALTGSSTSSSSSTSTAPTSTTVRTEGEPNDTFQNAYRSTSNSFGGTAGSRWIINATISSSSDIDIFDIGTGSSSDGVQNVSQTSNLENVTCNLYLKNNSLERNTNARLQTPTSSPDSSFVFQGRLNPSFSFSFVGNGALLYIICSGAANTSYSVQLDSVATSSSSSFLNTYTDYTTISSCRTAIKTCESKCSKSF